MALGTTVDNLLNRVRRDAVLGLHGPNYTLASSYTAGATAIVLGEDPMHMGPGSIVGLDAELFYVTAVDSASKTLTVIPGYLGTTQANHSTPNVVEVDPRFPKASLIDYAAQEIHSWSGRLWRTTALDVDASVTETTYDLGAVGDVYFLLDVRAEPTRSSVDPIVFSWTDDRWPHVDARIVREHDLSEFASGISLQLVGLPRRTGTLRVALAQPFDLSTFDLTTDLVSTVGVEAGWLDILEFGVRWRALSALTTARADWRTAGMAREGEEVTALDMIRVSGQARDMREMRLASEGLTLRARFPYRATP
jgi:hypothetical protein